ncbi:snaclec 3-like [Nothobranchius furzeri]|uniref:Snaclec 3-like n=1 Tax=Nothobranchius furzeri TaxID=105023 RepID=A0A9D2YSP9_NOTFU|nr:snaclec 3-like [Nothobranchius furzeri]
MERHRHPELVIFILLMMVLWLKADLEITLYCPARTLGWNSARSYCRSTYQDLVTWDIVDVEYMTKWLRNERFMTVWIGLQEDPDQAFVWKWINLKTGEGVTGENLSASSNWALESSVTGSCGSYSYTTPKKWHKTVCSTLLPFICFDDNLVVVTENMTWEDALSYCRKMTTSSYRYDLLSLTNLSDSSYISNRIYRTTTEEVWIGLRFLGGKWWWPDGQMTNSEMMLPDCPSQLRRCGVLSKNETGHWITRDCSESRNFICSRTKVVTSTKDEEIL